MTTLIDDSKSEGNEFDWHRSESHLRSIVKAVSYRIVGSVATGVIGGILTGSTKLALGLGLADILVKTFLFYAHERAWHKIKWGLSKDSDVDIGGGI